METRAKHVVVGAFVLAIGALAAIFVIWLSTSTLHDRGDRYLILFEGPVTGLQQGSQVRYRGIPVGSVRQITIDPADIEQVRVLVEVEEGTPLRRDNVATLEIAGLTGGSFVQITGGTQEAGPPEQPEDELFPVIDSQPSTLAILAEDAPRLLERLVELSDRASDFLSEENQESVTRILANADAISDDLAGLTGNVAHAAQGVEGMVMSVDGLVNELRMDVARLSDDASRVLNSLEDGVGTMGREAGETAEAAQALLDSASQTAASLRQVLDNSAPGLEDFVNTGLYEFTVMTAEVRELARNLSRLSDRFERSPSQFIFGPRGRGIPID